MHILYHKTNRTVKGYTGIFPLQKNKFLFIADIHYIYNQSLMFVTCHTLHKKKASPKADLLPLNTIYYSTTIAFSDSHKPWMLQ